MPEGAGGTDGTDCTDCRTVISVVGTDGTDDRTVIAPTAGEPSESVIPFSSDQYLPAPINTDLHPSILISIGARSPCRDSGAELRRGGLAERTCLDQANLRGSARIFECLLSIFEYLCGFLRIFSNPACRGAGGADLYDGLTTSTALYIQGTRTSPKQAQLIQIALLVLLGIMVR